MRCPQCMEQDFNLEEDNFCGLSSTIHLRCNICEEVISSAATSEKLAGKRGGPDVNRRAVTAMKEMGCGKAGLDRLAQVMDFPTSVEKESFSKHLKALEAASTTQAQHHLRAELPELIRQAYIEADPSLKDQDVIDIGVVCDGTWQKRGYTSHYNVTVISDILTGYILDYQVMSNYCVLCEKNQMETTSEDYRTWYAAHSPVCTINHRGSSKSMVSAAASTMFKRSVEKWVLLCGAAQRWWQFCVQWHHRPEWWIRAVWSRPSRCKWRLCEPCEQADEERLGWCHSVIQSKEDTHRWQGPLNPRTCACDTELLWSCHQRP